MRNARLGGIHRAKTQRLSRFSHFCRRFFLHQYGRTGPIQAVKRIFIHRSIVLTCRFDSIFNEVRTVP